MSRATLPIDDVLPQVLGAVRERGAAVLHAPTGAGKTTRVPAALLEDGDAVPDGRILVLEPRRVAARAAARRVATERGERVGQAVGYQVRFDKQVGGDTRVIFLTPGMLLRHLQSDPFLEDVGAVVFDEFHERSLDADLALALVRNVRREMRDDLAVVAMSATLDTASIAAWLDAPVVEARGRMYPVEIEHAGAGRPDHRDVPERAARAVEQVLGGEGPDGDVLVFMPGVGEIDRTLRHLGERALPPNTRCLPLHGRLRSDDQDRVFTPHRGRTVIVATNIAETSLTIPGVRTVVDSGLARVVRFDHGVGLERLELERISIQSATQRTGRAGREAPGLCVRLWSEIDERQMDAATAPEIQRVDLAGVCLQLACWGERRILDFDWFEPPDRDGVLEALALLEQLSAIAREGDDTSPRITATPLGRLMGRLPGHPRIARLLLDAEARNARDMGAAVAAVLSERTPRGLVDTRREVESDVVDAARALMGGGRSGRRGGGGLHWVRRVAEQYARQLSRLRADAREVLADVVADDPPETAAQRALLAAYPDRLAQRRSPRDLRARMVGGRGLTFDGRNASRLRRDVDLFVAVDVSAGRRGAGSESLVRAASAVERGWLTTESGVFLRFDDTLERVVAERQVRVDDIVLESHSARTPEGPEVTAILAAAAAERLDRILKLDDAEGPVRQWLTRVAFARIHCPELDLPELDEALLGEWVADGCHGKRAIAALENVDWPSVFAQRLPWPAQQGLKEAAPTRLTVPSGRSRRLTWSAQTDASEPPVLAVRIQELFGLTETPRVAKGRVPVMLHLLAPNYRPQQVTQDLAGFWSRTYPEVRKELRARYPKHAWPEDPVAARPIAK